MSIPFDIMTVKPSNNRANFSWQPLTRDGGQKTKLAEQLLESMGRLFGGVRGGIAISTVLVGALLAASTALQAPSFPRACSTQAGQKRLPKPTSTAARS